MRTFLSQPVLILSLEKDDERNFAKMQMKIWKLNNGTTILVRMFEHDKDAHKTLHDGKRTNGEVDDLVLNFLAKNKLVKRTLNWNYSVDMATKLQNEDEFEDKKECIYFAWEVKPEFLHF